MFKKCILLVLLIIKNSSQCVTPTFDKAVIKINTKSVTISGCISPDTVGFRGVTMISAMGQNIPYLNSGAVRDFNTSTLSINFRSNNIEIIREDAFLNLPYLSLIDLRGNNINSISGNSFRNLYMIFMVRLQNNAVNNIQPRAFNNLPNLWNVNFAQNHLESFDQGWFHLTPKLKVLDFRNNRLRFISKAAFNNLSTIEYLNFANNQIEYVDKDAFEDLPTLRRLYFNYNRLKSFEINFYTPSVLSYMGIQFNNITFISNKLMETIKSKLKKFWITGNPLQCPCFYNLLNWGFKHNIEVAFMCVQHEVVCVYTKTNSDECRAREDGEFLHHKFSKYFGSESICTPGRDYDKGED